MKSWLRSQAYGAAKLLSRTAKLDTLTLHYELSGILGWQNMRVSGEEFFLRGPLRETLAQQGPIIFDIGANVGDYSAALRTFFPSAFVIAFEPNPGAFAALSQKFDGDTRVTCWNMGLSATPGSMDLFDYHDANGSQHASLYRGVLSELHKARLTSSVKVCTERLDDFCDREGIERVDFLKVDTEGHELSVLKGAERILKDERLGIIQFEFNEMNVISRVFLRDFYDLLQGYSFFRLSMDRLIDLGDYTSKNELFKFQNIVATREPAASLWRKNYC